MLTVVEVVGDVDDACHVLGKVDHVPRDDAGDVVPLVLFVGEVVVDETVV